MEHLSGERVALARVAGSGAVLETPVLPSIELGEAVGCQVILKAENLQRTGSFKIRGAMAKVAALGEAARGGVIVGSAGNHARAVAYAARRAGVPCSIYMPAGASITKAEACTALGADVRLDWANVDDAVTAARADAEIDGLAFIHPFADLDVIAGQATLGLEIVEQVPDVSTVVIPLGGGGLASGVAWAVKRARPNARIVGVQASACAPWPLLLDWQTERREVRPAPTIADGIAVSRPGEVTEDLVASLVDEIVVVDDDDIADAVVRLFEASKLVVEGAGAVGVAALRAGMIEAHSGPIVVVLSGGNIDPGVLADAIRRHETRSGRRILLRARLDDRPGRLADLCRVLADKGANVVDIQHVREGIELHYGQTGVQIVAQVRSSVHGAGVVASAQHAGFDIQPMPSWPA